MRADFPLMQGPRRGDACVNRAPQKRRRMTTFVCAAHLQLPKQKNSLFSLIRRVMGLRVLSFHRGEKRGKKFFPRCSTLELDRKYGNNFSSSSAGASSPMCVPALTETGEKRAFCSGEGASWNPDRQRLLPRLRRPSSVPWNRVKWKAFCFLWDFLND